MNETFHDRLARIRKSQNFTAKEVANLIKVPASTYRDWENGKGLKVPPYLKISQQLNVSLSELITGERPQLGETLILLEELEEKVREIKLKLGSSI
jgi:transcriptional regulator with XRE-family HTH domain